MTKDIKPTKNQQETFDAIKTLQVIEKDDILNKVFRKQVKTEYNMLYSIAKQGLTNEKTEEILRKMFTEVILETKELLAIYTSLEIPIAEVETVKEPKKKAEKKLPRRYGKALIDKDIEKQDGKPTEVQRAMLAVNRLKNIYVNLSARGIKDMLAGANLLSDTDCRDIVAVINTVEKKLENILKRKK